MIEEVTSWKSGQMDSRRLSFKSQQNESKKHVSSNRCPITGKGILGMIVRGMRPAPAHGLHADAIGLPSNLPGRLTESAFMHQDPLS